MYICLNFVYSNLYKNVLFSLIILILKLLKQRILILIIINVMKFKLGNDNEKKIQRLFVVIWQKRIA